MRRSGVRPPSAPPAFQTFSGQLTVIGGQLHAWPFARPKSEREMPVGSKTGHLPSNQPSATHYLKPTCQDWLQARCQRRAGSRLRHLVCNDSLNTKSAKQVAAHAAVGSQSAMPVAFCKTRGEGVGSPFARPVQ